MVQINKKYYHLIYVNHINDKIDLYDTEIFDKLNKILFKYESCIENGYLNGSAEKHVVNRGLYISIKTNNQNIDFHYFIVGLINFLIISDLNIYGQITYKMSRVFARERISLFNNTEITKTFIQ